MPKAVIIKGNPQYIQNTTADKFYNELKAFVESLGYSVVFDDGSTNVEPPAADLWIGHSLGAEKLHAAPPETKTINLGNREGFYHPLDNVHNNKPPNRFHFTLSDPMKNIIRTIAKQASLSYSLVKLAERLSNRYRIE